MVAGGLGAGGIFAPSAAAAGGGGGVVGVVDPDEAKKLQKVRQKLQNLRVGLLRAAGRLGLPSQHEAVSQYITVLDKLEKMQQPMAKRRVDVDRLAYQTAQELNSREAPDTKVGVKVKLLVIGMSGVGKSQLINSLLDKPAMGTNAFRPATKGIKVVKGTVKGIEMVLIDTPGLQASSDKQLENLALLRKIKAAHKKYKPNFLVYVDR